MKAVIRSKYIALGSYIKRFERYQENNLMIYLKVRKTKIINTLKCRWKGIITVRAETKMKKNQKINKIKCQYTENSNKIDKYLAKLAKRKGAN